MADKAKKKSGGGLGLWIGLTTAALLIVIGISIFSLLSGNGDTENQDEVVSNGNIVSDITDIVVDSSSVPTSIVSARAVSTDNIEVDVPARGGGWHVIRSRPNIRMCSIDKSSVEMQYEVNGRWLAARPGGNGYVSAWRIRSRTDEAATYVYRWDSSRSCDTPIQD